MNFVKRHAGWLAPLLGFFGFVSYFLIAARYPLLRDVPVLHLLLVTAAAGLALHAVVASRGKSRKQRLLPLAGCLFTLGCAAMLFLYVFDISSRMPEPSQTTLGLTNAPSFSLPDANGRPVSLSDFGGRKVVLSFYRGHW